MAIKIIKQGKTKFTAYCDRCGCEFTYEMEDVVGEIVRCPCCKNHIVHTNSRCTPNKITRYSTVSTIKTK